MVCLSFIIMIFLHSISPPLSHLVLIPSISDLQWQWWSPHAVSSRNHESPTEVRRHWVRPLSPRRSVGEEIPAHQDCRHWRWRTCCTVSSIYLQESLEGGGVLRLKCSHWVLSCCSQTVTRCTPQRTVTPTIFKNCPFSRTGFNPPPLLPLLPLPSCPPASLICTLLPPSSPPLCP